MHVRLGFFRDYDRVVFVLAMGSLSSVASTFRTSELNRQFYVSDEVHSFEKHHALHCASYAQSSERGT